MLSVLVNSSVFTDILFILSITSWTVRFIKCEDITNDFTIFKDFKCVQSLYNVVKKISSFYVLKVGNSHQIGAV